jgi:hypothetical protein
MDAEWSDIYPAFVKDSPGFTNLRLVPAWRKLKAIGGLTAVKAAAKTGIHPLNEYAENHTNGLDLLARKFSIETPWRDEDKEFHADWTEGEEGPKYMLMQTRAKAPNRALLVRSKADEYFRESTVIPSQALCQELTAQKAAKKIKVNAKPNRKNPDTTCGLSVCGGVVEEAYAIQSNREDAKVKKALDHARTQYRRMVRSQNAIVSFHDVVWTICDRAFDWEWSRLAGRGGLFGTTVLRTVLQQWTEISKYGENMNKEQVVEDLRYRLCAFRTALFVSGYCALKASPAKHLIHDLRIVQILCVEKK